MSMSRNIRIALAASFSFLTLTILTVLSFALHTNPDSTKHLAGPLASGIITFIILLSFTCISLMRSNLWSNEFDFLNNLFFRWFSMAALLSVVDAAILTALRTHGSLCRGFSQPDDGCGPVTIILAAAWLRPIVAIIGLIVSLVIVYNGPSDPKVTPFPLNTASQQKPYDVEHAVGQRDVVSDPRTRPSRIRGHHQGQSSKPFRAASPGHYVTAERAAGFEKPTEDRYFEIKF